jgi:energy-coupling factor transporter ATP-binding protein EcfA2
MIKINNLFDSFNARYLSFEEIADSFIGNKQFEDLKLNNHSLLMGPRGSGKTTLLKMLTPACQYISNQYRSAPMPFWGVYIPTDIQWKRQIEYFEQNTTLKTNIKNVIAKTIVRTNIQISLLKTFVSILEIHKANSESDFIIHYDFSTKLIDSWSIKKPISADLNSIEGALRNRLTQINSLIEKIQNQLIQDSDIKLEDFYSHDYLDLVKTACFLFESSYKTHESFVGDHFRWALCFDELEIAPKWLQKDLIDRMRSSEQNILFKLTTSPIISLSNELSESAARPEARQEEDYKVIRTWICKDYDNNSWINFCKKLISQKLQKRSIAASAEELFGLDLLERNLGLTFDEIEVDATNSFEVKSYSRGSLLWSVFRELALTDSTFFRFLANKNIRPTNPVPENDAQIDSVFRKIKPLVIFRYQFKSAGRLRSRKNPSLYYGLPFLYELCDGNPRALMALLDIFISNIKKTKKGRIRPFTINLQSSIITQFSHNYLKLITAHPDSNKLIKKGNYSNLGDLISVIGGYFFESIVIDPFKMDPTGSFVVDDKVPPKLKELIDLGVQLGAIIYINPSEAISGNGVVGKRFRLSYLLHPYFRLPKREYDEVQLSKITNQYESQLIKQTLLF